MRAHAYPLLLALLVLLVPTAAAGAAQPSAGALKSPTVSSVRLTGAATTGRIAVQVLVRHAPIADPAAGTRSIGSVTVILTRFEGDRNHTIGGASAAHVLPILTTSLNVVYAMLLSARQSASVRRASHDGTLHALVLIDQRAQARGHAPGRSGGFLQVSARLTGAPRHASLAAPPFLTLGARAKVIIGADAAGRSILERAEVPISGGRLLVLTTGGAAGNGLLSADGAASALKGMVHVLAADGQQLAVLPAPPGFTFAMHPQAPQAGVLVWPTFEATGTEPVAAGQLTLRPPSAKRSLAAAKQHAGYQRYAGRPQRERGVAAGLRRRLDAGRFGRATKAAHRGFEPCLRLLRL